MACAAVAVDDKEERENFFCLTLLLFQVGNNTLRQYFTSRWLAITGTPWTDSPADGNQLYTAGGLNKMGKQEKGKVQSGDTTKWDLTVLTQVLMHSALRLTPPGSTESNELDKLRKIRNEKICHAKDVRLQTVDFTPNWQDACNALKLFGANQAEIDAVVNDARKPWKEFFPLLKQCLSQEDDILIAVKSIDDKLSTLHENHKEIKKDLQQSKEAIIWDHQLNTAEIKREIQKLESKLDEVHLGPKKAPEAVRRAEAQRFSSYLKQHYTSGENAVIQPLPWMDDTLFEIKRMFTRLRVVHREKARSLITDEKIAMYEVFKLHKDREKLKNRTVLIEGKPGIGKTTFCRKLTYDWATGNIPPSSSSSFPEFDLVLLLKCRDIESGGIWQAIENQLLPEELTGENQKRGLFEYIKENQEKVLLIIDGYDELSADKYVQESLARVISGRALSYCSIIVTTRHEKGVKIRKHFDELLEIKGFEWNDTCEFIKSYFHSSPSLAASLTSLVYRNSLLKDLVSSPLNTALLCALHEDLESNDRQLLQTNTTNLRELYQEIVLCVTRRYCTKEGKDYMDDDALMEEYRQVYAMLGKLAFDCIQSDKLYFKEGQVLPNSRELLSKLGFLVKEKSARKLSSEGVFSFTHKTIQDYFASIYVTECFTSGDISILHAIKNIEIISAIRYFDVLAKVTLSTRKTIDLILSLATLLPHEGLNTKDNLFNSIVFTFMCELIGSLRDETEMQAAANATCGCLSEWGYCHVSCDETAGGLCCFLLCPNEEVSNANDNTTGFASSAMIAARNRANSPLSELKITGLDSRISDAMLAKLADALSQRKGLTALALSENVCFHGFSTIFNSSGKHESVTHLDLSFGVIKDCDVEGIGKVFSELKALLYVNLSNNKLGDVGASAIADGLRNNHKLAALDILGCSIGVEGCRKVANALNSNNNLTVLNMNENEIGDAGACAIAETLLMNKSLKKLRLGSNNIGDVGFAVLARGLTRNSTLILLDISFNWVGDQGSCAIAYDALMNNTSLTHLYINNCIFSDFGMCAVANVLTNKNKTLTHLGIALCPFGEDGFRAMGYLMTKSTTLTHLNITWRGELSESATRTLVDIVSRNTTLTWIGLGKTHGELIRDPRVHISNLGTMMVLSGRRWTITLSESWDEYEGDCPFPVPVIFSERLTSVWNQTV